MLWNKRNWYCLPITILTLFQAVSLVKAEEYEVRFWFDSDSALYYTQTFTSEEGKIILSIEPYVLGAFHQINFQLRDRDGEWSIPYSQFFIESVNKLELEYCIDGNSSKTELDYNNPAIDASSLSNGTHYVMITDKNGNLLSDGKFFNSKKKVGGELSFEIQSLKNNIRKTTVIPCNEDKIEVDVSDIKPGLYPIVATLKDPKDDNVIATISQFVNINPLGGNKVTDIYYWLNDSTTLKKRIEVKDGKMPFKFTDSIDVSDLYVPTPDYSVRKSDEGTQIVPNYNIGVGIISNFGYQNDSTSYYTDNSKIEDLNAVVLESGRQHDYGVVSPQDILWTKIPVQTGDEIKLAARLWSTVRLFDDGGLLLDTITFNQGATSSIFKVNTPGFCYAEIYDVEKSRREFSVMMTYIDGPSKGQALNEDSQYEGILIDWKAVTEWEEDQNNFKLSKKGIELVVPKFGVATTPELTKVSNICRLYENNELIISSKGYIEKVTLCLPEENKIPQVYSQNGNIEIDRDKHIAIWTGFAKEVKISIGDLSSELKTEGTEVAEFLLKKAYVKLSDIDNTVFAMDEEEFSEDFRWEGYNMMDVFENGKLKGTYNLEKIAAVTFEDKGMSILYDESIDLIGYNNGLIIIYYNNPSSDEDVVGIESIVDLNSEEIIINGLPNFVGIYTLDGQTVYSGYVNSANFSYSLQNLRDGIYIIMVGSSTFKILIK